MSYFPIYAGVLGVALSAVSGCSGGSSAGDDDPIGGGGGGGTDPDPIDLPSDLNVATAAESAAYYDIVNTDFPTVRSAAVAGGGTPLPTTGTVTYEGYMNLIVGNATVSANVIGAATVQASFASATLSGSATDFMGVAIDEYDTTQVAHYEGTITIDNGDIFAGTDGSADVDFDISGTLDNGLNLFAVDGNLVGGFNGTNADGLYALGSNTGVHGDIDATIDGAAATIGIATVSVVAVP
ncbi:hypothetical protein [Yoonia sp. BS5-3]|uniref:Transferrin-binding protein B C-lobe/N-lobe beta barrel domain-containing protein n=1 Tax=Yoonia phaeophyticola TaxID=3137369 RepID=A0ABZ2V580_9RHOB